MTKFSFKTNKAKMIAAAGFTAFAVAMVFNTNAELKSNAKSNVFLQNAEALAVSEEASGDFWCCSPYTRKCAVGDQVTIWGTLKRTACP